MALRRGDSVVTSWLATISPPLSAAQGRASEGAGPARGRAAFADRVRAVSQRGPGPPRPSRFLLAIFYSPYVMAPLSYCCWDHHQDHKARSLRCTSVVRARVSHWVKGGP